MILLVTHFSWDSPTGGACILRHFVGKLHREPIHWFALSQPAGLVPFRANHVTREYITAPGWGNVRLRLGGFWAWYKRVWWARTAAARIEWLQNELKARAIWLVADYTLGSVGLRLLPKLARRQVHVSLHDHPLESARRAGFCRYDLREIAAFQSGLAALHPTVDAVSEELLKAIMPDVKRTSIIALPAMSCATAPAVVGPTTEGPLRFGLSGNFFGQEELNCFLHGLEQWSSRTGRDWRLLVFGRKPEGKLDQRIDFRGFRPIEEARDQLARCDVLLLPLPVDADSIQMRTSVPTKLTTYLEVGRLVFAFAPSGSATERIIAQSALGPVVTRLDPSVVAGQLNQLATWNLAAANVGRQRLLEHRYNEHRMLSDLNCLLSP